MCVFFLKRPAIDLTNLIKLNSKIFHGIMHKFEAQCQEKILVTYRNTSYEENQVLPLMLLSNPTPIIDDLFRYIHKAEYNFSWFLFDPINFIASYYRDTIIELNRTIYLCCCCLLAWFHVSLYAQYLKPILDCFGEPVKGSISYLAKLVLVNN